VAPTVVQSADAGGGRAQGLYKEIGMRLLLVWLVNAVALIALPYLMSSIRVDSFAAALIAALVLSLINTFIRPLLVLLTLPATVLTLGLFIFVINGLLFWFVGSFVQGFHVAGFWSAVGGAILYSIISWALSALLLPAKQ
jgi:putative membrane protein